MRSQVCAGVLRKLFGVCLFALCLTGGQGEAHVGSHLQGGKAQIVTIKLHHYQAGLRRLISEGYDIAGVSIQDGTADVVVGDTSFEELKSMAIGSVVTRKMIDPEAGPDQGYTTYDELVVSLNRFKTSHPQILSVESIGKSHEGRDIFAVKISKNVAIHENKPAIFFNAMHHAREVMTTEVALDIIDQLTSGYDNNNRVKEWVDSNEIWIVPMVNPDGNNKVWTVNNMWRKNTREGYGVDINRNYPYAWGTCNGSSGSTFSDTYRGPAAGSEPETQAMMNLVARIQPVMSISYHSYSELVIYPFGCDGQHTPERETIESVGRALAGRLPKDGNSGTYDPGTSWELLYAVDGGDIDWYYNAHNVLPYVIEVNAASQGFQPPFNWRQRTVEKMRAGWGYILDRARQSGIRGAVVSGGKILSEGSVTVTPVNAASVLGDAVHIHKIKYDGTFHVVLNPGMYRVAIHAGGRTFESEVLVGADLHELEVNL
jgi:carboxypeptidase T